MGRGTGTEGALCLGLGGEQSPSPPALASHAFLLLTATVTEGFTSLFPSFSTSFCHGGKKRIKDCENRLTHIFLLGKAQVGTGMT